MYTRVLSIINGEPIRVICGALAAAILAVLHVLGVISLDAAEMAAIGATLLGVVEFGRSRVSPVV
jgi:hypothetical protein